MPRVLARVQARAQLDARGVWPSLVGNPARHAARAHAAAPPADAVRVLPPARALVVRGAASGALPFARVAVVSAPRGDATQRAAPVVAPPPVVASARHARAAVVVLDDPDRSPAPPRALSSGADYEAPAASSRRCVFSL